MWAAKADPTRYLNYDGTSDGAKVQLWSAEENPSRWYPRFVEQGTMEVGVFTAWVRTA